MKTLLLKIFSKDFSVFFSVLFVFFIFASFYMKNFLFLIMGFFSLTIFSNKKRIIILALLFLIAFILFFYLHKYYFISQKVEGNFKVYKSNFLGPTIKYKSQVILIKTKEIFNDGDTINISGNTSEIKGKYKSFLNKEEIFNEIKYCKVKLIKQSNYFRIRVVNWVNNKNETYSKYFSLLVLGSKNNHNQDVVSISKKLNIVHIIVISGFHIGIFKNIFQKIFCLFKIRTEISNIFVALLISFYLYLVNFTVPSLRSALFILFKYINKKWLKKSFSEINILSLIALGISFFNPQNIFSFSFILSFLISFLILFLNYFPWKNSKAKNFYSYFIIYIFLIPFNAFLNESISIFGILFNFVFTPLFSVTYMLSLLLFAFEPILIFFYSGIEKIIYLSEKINIIVRIKFLDMNLLNNLYCFLFISIIIFAWLNFFMVKKATW